MTCISSAFIVGGGLAGTSAAIALARAGVQCDVVDVADVPLGASIGISGRPAETLVELGIYDDALALSHVYETDTRKPTTSDAEGRLLSSGPKRPSWPGAVNGITIYRPILIELLERQALSLGANIRRGVTTHDIRFEGDGVQVTTTDGAERRYDLLVGADGLNSKTRAMLFPAAPKPAYAGQLSVRWMAPGPEIPDEGWFVSPLGRVGFYSLPQGMLYVGAIFDMPEQRRLSDDELYNLFAELLDSVSAPQIVELRKRLSPGAALIGRFFESLLMPPPWHHGQALLIGDAVHATTAHMGMGGGMALEDSVVLGQCVAAAATLPEALDAFMTRRYDRVRTVVETSRRISQLEQDKAPALESHKAMTDGFEALARPY